MSSSESRVAIYVDFDNVVISRANQVKETEDPATIAIDVLLDFATRYGRLTISRAYADWSVSRNNDYREQLVARAVELVQLFPASKTKNGADIRLAVDAIEDLYLHRDLTHVVIAAGDSDFVPVVQRARRLGRFVVGIGVAGSISKTLRSACDVYVEYDELLHDRKQLEEEADRNEARTEPRTVASAPVGPRPSRSAYSLVIEALSGLGAQHPERDWHALGAVKGQILRIQPAFTERAFGASSFTELVGRYGSHVEVKDNRARLRDRVSANS